MDLKLDRDLAGHIDHSLLHAAATPRQIVALCKEAVNCGFAAVCINPIWVRLAAESLQGTPVAVCTVVGFPLGAGTTEVKVLETRRAVSDGATEIDMVLNIGALKAGQDEWVGDDIRRVVEAAHDAGARCKVILETAYLESAEKIRACAIAKKSGADFVKTSTGFAPRGASIEDVALMSKAVGPEVGVKAAGGIKDSAQARAMLEAGATRLGTSAGVKIVQEPAAENGG